MNPETEEEEGTSKPEKKNWKSFKQTKQEFERRKKQAEKRQKKDEQRARYLEKQEAWWPVSPEFANYALALLVYSVRYPAVFWNTNKGLAFIFSLALIVNSIQVIPTG